MADSGSETKIFGITIKKKDKKIVVASKTTMNLVDIEKTISPVKIVIIALCVIAVGIVAAKFGFLDPMQKRTDATNNLLNKRLEQEAMAVKLASYSELEEKYNRYSDGWLTDAEKALLERSEVFKVIEEKLKPNCVVETAALNANTLTLSIHGVTLDQAREIVKSLREDSRIASATVYSAVASDENLLAKINMTIVFTKEAE